MTGPPLPARCPRPRPEPGGRPGGISRHPRRERPEAPVLRRRSPRAVPDDRLRGVDDPISSAQNPVNHVHVLGALERGTRSKPFVERARSPENAASGGEVGSAADAPGVSPLREDRAPFGRVDRGRLLETADTSLGQGPPHDRLRAVGHDRRAQRLDPLRVHEAVIVGERDDRPRAVGDPLVLRPGEPRAGPLDVPNGHDRPFPTGDGAAGRLVPALIHDDHLGRCGRAGKDGIEAPLEESAPIASADEDRDIQTGRHRFLNGTRDRSSGSNRGRVRPPAWRAGTSCRHRCSICPGSALSARSRRSDPGDRSRE